MYSLHSGDGKTETSFTDCNQGVSKAVASSGGSRGESLPWHFQPWWLPASLTCGCVLPINTSMDTLPPPLLCRVTLCLSFVKILLMALRDHPESPGKSHLKISCLATLILPCHASLHIYRLCVGDSDPFGDPLSVYHLMYSNFGEKKTQIFIPHLSICGRVEG